MAFEKKLTVVLARNSPRSRWIDKSNDGLDLSIQTERKVLILALFFVLFSLTFPKTGTTAENATLRIAIADLVNISANAELDAHGQSVAEGIFTKLALSGKFSVVERERLFSDTVIEAIKEITTRDLATRDASTLTTIRGTVGARYILVGTLSEFNEKKVILVSTRLIDVEDSREIAGWTEQATEKNLPQVGSKIGDAILDRLITGDGPPLRDIAIADLENISGNAELDRYGRSISETLFAELAFSQKLSLVERSRLKDAIKEISRGELGIIDPNTVARIGRAVGARYIFVGTLSEFAEGVVIVSTRLIDVESGRVVSGWNKRTTVNRLSQVPFDLAEKILGQLFPESPIVAALKSTIIPGWGQLSNNRKASGALAILGSAAAIGAVTVIHFSLSSAEDDLENLRKPVTNGDMLISVEAFTELTNQIKKQEKDVNTKRDQRKTALITLGVVWGVNVLDAFLETSLERKSRQRTVTIEATSDFRGAVLRVRF